MITIDILNHVYHSDFIPVNDQFMKTAFIEHKSLSLKISKFELKGAGKMRNMY